MLRAAGSRRNVCCSGWLMAKWFENDAHPPALPGRLADGRYCPGCVPPVKTTQRIPEGKAAYFDTAPARGPVWAAPYRRRVHEGQAEACTTNPTFALGPALTRSPLGVVRRRSVLPETSASTRAAPRYPAPGLPPDAELRRHPAQYRLPGRGPGRRDWLDAPWMNSPIPVPPLRPPPSFRPRQRDQNAPPHKATARPRRITARHQLCRQPHPRKRRTQPLANAAITLHRRKLVPGMSRRDGQTVGQSASWHRYASRPVGRRINGRNGSTPTPSARR